MGACKAKENQAGAALTARPHGAMGRAEGRPVGRARDDTLAAAPRPGPLPSRVLLTEAEAVHKVDASRTGRPHLEVQSAQF